MQRTIWKGFPEYKQKQTYKFCNPTRQPSANPIHKKNSALRKKSGIRLAQAFIFSGLRDHLMLSLLHISWEKKSFSFPNGIKKRWPRAKRKMSMRIPHAKVLNTEADKPVQIQQWRHATNNSLTLEFCK